MGYLSFDFWFYLHNYKENMTKDMTSKAGRGGIKETFSQIISVDIVSLGLADAHLEIF